MFDEYFDIFSKRDFLECNTVHYEDLPHLEGPEPGQWVHRQHTHEDTEVYFYRTHSDPTQPFTTGDRWWENIKDVTEQAEPDEDGSPRTRRRLAHA